MKEASKGSKNMKDAVGVGGNKEEGGKATGKGKGKAEPKEAKDKGGIKGKGDSSSAAKEQKALQEASNAVNAHRGHGQGQAKKNASKDGGKGSPPVILTGKNALPNKEGGYDIGWLVFHFFL